MNFESLANELLLDIFEYFNAIQLLHTFHDLNIRFNKLIYLYLQSYPLDFRSVSKQDFDNICQKNLPLITNQIISIHLSNDDDTPEQPNLFFSFGFHFQQFTKLQSLSLYYIRSTDLINNIIHDCPHLIYLKISKCNFDDHMEKAQICVNNIWNLIKLKYCYLDIPFCNNFHIPLSTIISLSLENLSIANDLFNINDLICLFQHTPNLQNLNLRIEDTSYNEQFPFIIPLLSKLKISFKGSLDTLKNLLQNMPTLSELIIETDGIYIDGYQWEQIIINYLYKLNVFRLLMFYKIDVEKNINDEIDQLLESFQTKFWLHDHQWFVRCDSNTEYGFIYLYTLPYGFKKFYNLASDMSKSTCSIDKKYHISNYVNSLSLDYFLLRFASQFPLQFSNINHLELSFPFDDVIWSILSKFDRLISIELVSIIHPDESDRPITHLRLLLNRAINLYSITMDYLIMSQLSLVQIINKSIRRLDLIANDGHFYGLECISLIQSFLGDQCEVLLINIENRSIVLDLVEKMPNLRALTFQCQDDQWGDSNESLLIEDEFIQWLKHRLPSNCLVVRDESELSAIRLWIR
ncbi:unnamed protein product [Rotaria sordida]|uniref:F-box domain-containing protein n=1 Tax=Rotaria sordida TaxID=392033 RepID=A0A819H9K5_9BILA|nr:unnamed protein product [Rotaria sordida]